MPKDAKKRDYSKTVIYQIECKNPNITKTYGGHTTNLIKRRQHHKTHCNNPNDDKYNIYVYKFIRDNGGWENWQVVWQYDYPCGSIKEAEKEETKFIKENKCELNSIMPYVSEEEKKEKRNVRQAKKRAEIIENETEEEKKERKRKEKEENSKYYAKKKEKETEEEKAERLEKARKYKAKKKEEETEEEEKERLEKARKKYKEKYSEKNKVKNLTEEQKAKKKEKNRLYREKQKLLKQNKLVVI
tara:strand:- start:765 stop:1496 length:732 start_codon:yes stop_codon:yes gene_type:complete